MAWAEVEMTKQKCATFMNEKWAEKRLVCISWLEGWGRGGTKIEKGTRG